MKPKTTTSDYPAIEARWEAAAPSSKPLWDNAGCKWPMAASDDAMLFCAAPVADTPTAGVGRVSYCSCHAGMSRLHRTLQPLKAPFESRLVKVRIAA
jgi:hypothetical protein